MLSTVLRSKRAIQANIAIMRAFVRIRELGAQNRDSAVFYSRLSSNAGRPIRKRKNGFLREAKA